MTILLIDDLRSFRGAVPSLLVARTQAAGLALLETRDWDQIWLDHDLGLDSDGRVSTIMPVVDRLCERAFNGDPVSVGRIIVHSANPIGADQMVKSLRRYGYLVTRANPSDYFNLENEDESACKQ